MFRDSDTIAAIATPAGAGALAIIRVSGPAAWEVTARVFRSPVPPAPPTARVARVGDVVDAAGGVIDRGVLVLWKAPHSYAGEDMAELTVHAGPAVVGATLEAVFAAGARPAEAGEFTWRAVRNGKMDLTAAAAVADLAAARTDAARKDALRRLAGELTLGVNAARDAVVAARALVEGHVEFGQEADAAAVISLAAEAARDLRALTAASRDREALNRGVAVAIAGPPNAGKSTLFNRLLGEDRSIVTATPGTTRDRVDADVILGGALFRLADLAGVGDAPACAVDAEGMRRARAFLEDAALVIWLDDVTAAPPAEAPPLEAARLIRVLNKVDAPAAEGWARAMADAGVFKISARDGAGVDRLVAEIVRRADGGGSSDGLSLSARERRLLEEAAGHLDAAAARVRAAGVDEVAAEDLRLAADALGNVIGVVDVEEVYDEVFKRFCLGK